MRFTTSAPVPVLQSTGTRPMIMVATVINLGRRRFAAPSTVVSFSSALSRSRPSPQRAPMSQREVKQHHHARLSVQPGQRDDAAPDRDADIVLQEIQAY